ncbi:MAG: LLM class F420-dependent oxidoreductase [Dehalococcoidia bacterium]
MKIGLQPPNSGPSATPALMTELAELGDALGYHSLQITDHVVIPAQINSRYPYSPSGVMAARPDDNYYEPLSLLAYLIGRTRRIRLGTSVLILPYRNPVVVAKQLACMDNLSGGRIVLGAGAGWMAEEFSILGSPPFAERGAVMDEYICVLRTIWTEQRPQFAGRYTSFQEMGVNPKPVQSGGIPIVIGGDSRPAIRRAVRLGDGWQPFKLTPDELAGRLAYLRQQAEQQERDLSTFTISLRLGLRLTDGAGQLRPGEEPWKTLVGSADEAIDRLATYRDLGVNEIVFDFRTCSLDEMRDTIRRCAEHIIPAFASA